MSAIHTVIVATIQFALALMVALWLWVILGEVIHAILARTIWRVSWCRGYLRTAVLGAVGGRP